MARAPRRPLVESRKTPRQARSRDLVEAILTATARVLAREGYEATSTTRVAQVAGVSIGSVYQYFPTKEALVAALVDAHVAKMVSLLAAAASDLADAPMEEAVRSLVRALLLAHAVDPELHAELTRNFARVDGYEKVRALNARARELLEGYLRHAATRTETLRPKDPALASFVLVHAVQGVVSAAVSDDAVGVGDEALVDELVSLVVGFLRSPP